jgi:hypothetical protein
MRKIVLIARRRHGLVAITLGTLALIGLCGVGLVLGDPVLKVALAGFGVMLLAGDVLYIGSEWLDEWRYQRLADVYQEAMRTGRPQVIDDRPSMFSAFDHGQTYAGDPMYADDDVDVSDTQTGQGVE